MILFDKLFWNKLTIVDLKKKKSFPCVCKHFTFSDLLANV